MIPDAPPYTPALPRPATLLGLVLLFGLLAVLGRENYLLFHGLAELFSIGICVIAGVVAWYTYPFSRNAFLMLLGSALPWVGVLDLLHALSYKGMHFFPGDSANLPTQFWIAARYLQSAAFLAAPLVINRPLRAGHAFIGFGLAATLLFLWIMSGHFPVAYREGTGLTAFKVGSEYLIVVLLGLASVLLWQQKRELDRQVLILLTLSIALTIASELAFTLYHDVYGIANMVGHLFKIAALWLVFLAIVHTTLREPFRQMSRDVTTYDSIPYPILLVDCEGLIGQANRVAGEQLGLAPAELAGRNCHDLFHPRELTPEACPVCRVLRQERAADTIELFFADEQIWRTFSLAPVRTHGRSAGMVHVSRDITPRKQAELNLLRVNRALMTVSACNEALVHATDESQLLEQICRIIVEQGGYRMAWVGYTEPLHKRVVPTAHAGAVDGYLDDVTITWDESEYGLGPAGQTMRSGHVTVSNDIARDAGFAPWREAALARGYRALITYPLTTGTPPPFGILAIYSAVADAFTDEEVQLLDQLAKDLAYGILALRNRDARSRAEADSRQNLARLSRAMQQTIEAVAGTIEKRDPYTAGHQRRVAELAETIGREMGLDDFSLEGLHMGGMIHDIGKIGVPAEILNRPGRLSDTEFDIIKEHVVIGRDIISGIDFPWPIVQMVAQHHERLDGTGYPEGLKGDEIVPEARILAVADVVEAMASNRPYRPGFGLEVALNEIEQGRGTHYDPNVVDTCLKLFREKGYELEIG